MGFFNSSRGLRQGDSLFPLRFVIVMEAVSKLVSGFVEVGFLSCFSVGNCTMAPLIVPIFISRWYLMSHSNFEGTLLYFEAASCLKVNLAKSKLVRLVNASNVVNLTSIMGYKVSSLLMKYLGLPLVLLSRQCPYEIL